MTWFKIDGVEYNVRIFDPEESFTILYGENTGRTLDEGAPMILDPIGTFFNYKLTIGRKKGEINDFDELWTYLSTPRSKPMRVVLPRNQTIWFTPNENGEIEEGFYAYVSNGKRKIKKIIEDEEGVINQVDYDVFQINIIATKAQVLPEDE